MFITIEKLNENDCLELQLSKFSSWSKGNWSISSCMKMTSQGVLKEEDIPELMQV